MKKTQTITVNGVAEGTTEIEITFTPRSTNYSVLKKTVTVTLKHYSKYVLANKHHYLGKDYVPKKLVKIPSEYTMVNETIKGTNEAVSRAIIMIKDASSQGGN